MINPIPRTQEGTAYSEQAIPRKTKAWKWEKKHWLIVIALACLVLFWLGPRLKAWPVVQTTIDYLPALGSLILVGDKLLKLI